MPALSSRRADRWLRPQTARNAVFSVAAAALALGLVLPVAQVKRLMGENGPVESITVACYFVAALLLALLRPPAISPRTAIMLTILLAAFGARELDLHKAFTVTSMLRLSFYASDAPLLHKAVSLLLLAPVVAAVVGLARRAPCLVHRARRHEAAALTIVVFMLTIVIAKVADRSVNILLEDLAVAVSPRLSAMVLSLEEVLELSLPLLACLGWAQAHRNEAVLLRPRLPGAAP